MADTYLSIWETESRARSFEPSLVVRDCLRKVTDWSTDFTLNIFLIKQKQPCIILKNRKSTQMY